MNLIIRVFLTLIAAFRDRRLGSVLDDSVRRYRVCPNDLDTNFHMNNGRYLTIMDLGRLDLVLRSGLLGVAMRNRWMPVLGAAAIRFRISLQPFQKYALRTRVISWDEKWVYMEQRFEIIGGPRDGAVAAFALVKGAFKKGRETVPTSQIMAALAQTGTNAPDTPPEMPEYVREWVHSEDAMRTALRKDIRTASKTSHRA